jgi:uncharacterized OB-fold protein
MDETLSDVEPMVYESGINVPYSWWAGDTASRFFISLRDDKKVDVSDEGVVQSFTIARRQLASLPEQAPVMFGLVKLDGADTALLHFLNEVDPKDIRIGMRVKAKFADDRTAGIRDIAYFRPVT